MYVCKYVCMYVCKHVSMYGVRQGRLLSPTLFNIFLERIMADALEDREGTVSIGGRNIQTYVLLMTLAA